MRQVYGGYPQKVLLEKDQLPFAQAREIAERCDDLAAVKTNQIAVLFQKSSNPKRFYKKQIFSALATSQPSVRCLSCGEQPLRSTCRFRNIVCHGCGKPCHI